MSRVFRSTLVQPLCSIVNKFSFSKRFIMVSPAKKMACELNNDHQTCTIGTHDGVFHCDESLGCFLLKQLPQYKDATIIRTRDDAKLDKCSIVLDVGRIYDHNKNRYDHHQSTFDYTLSKIYEDKKFGNIKLSSAGLIYAHFGHQIISEILNLDKDDSKTDRVFDMVYDNFIKEIDGIDNGINMFDGEPCYQITTSLSQRVAYLKPNWNEESNPEILYERFLQAVALTGKEFIDRVQHYGNVWLPARIIVLEAFKKRFDFDPSGRIVVLTQTVPWIQHLFQIEQEENAEGQIAFVLFRDQDCWRVRAVPNSPDSFELRNPIRSEWRGLVKQQLDEASKVNGCVFVHSTGFIGGNVTQEGALEMARKSIQ